MNTPISQQQQQYVIPTAVLNEGDIKTILFLKDVDSMKIRNLIFHEDDEKTNEFWTNIDRLFSIGLNSKVPCPECYFYICSADR
jgi:hypothetical protein